MASQPPFMERCEARRSGKVRDIYKFGRYLLLVATDRISVYDVVLPTPIPDKGRVLTELSSFWFQRLGTPHHLVTTDLDEMRKIDERIDFGDQRDDYEGRSMLVQKTEVFPVECVVRGYLAGSGWEDYQRTGSVCGKKLPECLLECAKLPEPIFTPATKATNGHDQNIDESQAAKIIGCPSTLVLLRILSINIYKDGAAYARERGIVIADTKFEFGLPPDHGQETKGLLVDEVLTPDSSRFWPLDGYEPGRPQQSFDKQFVRDYVKLTGWGKSPPGPELPPRIVAQTREKYLEAYERLVGRQFPWE